MLFLKKIIKVLAFNILVLNMVQKVFDLWNEKVVLSSNVNEGYI